MSFERLSLAAITVLFLAANAQAQHLWWNLEGQQDATCVYGEITVLATHHAIYYCGANWHPGEPAGGYCGIQHNSERERRTIFSIWDTSPQLHPKVTAADRKTIFNRFGGEGEGAHTHMLWPWKVGDTFQFFVHKQQGKDDTTDARYYIYDRSQEKWLQTTRDRWLSPVELQGDGAVESRSAKRRALNKGFLPLNLEQYLELLHWTGRPTRRDKRGQIPAELSPILRRLRLSTETWVETVLNFGRWFRLAAGRLDTLAAEAARRGRRWLQGVSHSRAAFA